MSRFASDLASEKRPRPRPKLCWRRFQHGFLACRRSNHRRSESQGSSSPAARSSRRSIRSARAGGALRAGREFVRLARRLLDKFIVGATFHTICCADRRRRRGLVSLVRPPRRLCGFAAAGIAAAPTPGARLARSKDATGVFPRPDVQANWDGLQLQLALQSRRRLIVQWGIH